MASCELDACDTTLCAMRALHTMVQPLLPEAAEWDAITRVYPASQSQETLLNALRAYRGRLDAMARAVQEAKEAAEAVQAAMPAVDREVDEFPDAAAPEATQRAMAWRQSNAIALVKAAKQVL